MMPQPLPRTASFVADETENTIKVRETKIRQMELELETLEAAIESMSDDDRNNPAVARVLLESAEITRGAIRAQHLVLAIELERVGRINAAANGNGVKQV